MARLDALIGARRNVVLAVWLALAVAAAPFALHQSDHLSAGGFSVGHSQSAAVDEALARKFPQLGRTEMAVLLWPLRGATAGGLEAAVGRVQRALRGIGGVTLSKQTREKAVFAAGLAGPMLLPLEVSVGESRAMDIAGRLRARLHAERGEKVEMHLLGESALWTGLQETARRQLAAAERIAFPLLLIALLMIFGSFWAAALPLALGAVAVVIAGALIYCCSLAVGLSSYTVNAASMLGLGIAVDYSLIMVARMRQELAGGCDAAAARGRMLGTSGTVVLFSGLTVIVALAGVWAVPVATLRSMALGGMLVIAVSVVASLTLLPALVDVLGAGRVGARGLRGGRGGRKRREWGGSRGSRGSGGSREQRPPGRRGRHSPPGRHSHGGWERWAEVVTGHPLVWLIAAGALLIAFCAPALSMQTGTGVLAQLDSANETRVAFARAASIAGPGALAPVFVVIHAERHLSGASLLQATARARNLARHAEDVRELGATQRSPAGAYAAFTVVPSVSPESAAAEGLVRRLRRSLSQVARSSAGVRVGVGGGSARQLDEVQAVRASIWMVLAIVLGISLIPLTVLLRSVLLPVKAILMNMLSVGAAYGVLVIVFQWGWFDGPLGYRAPGRVDTIVPPLLLALVFGLSTDYEVFLLSRIRERWLSSGSSRRAVAEGLAASARTISGAAFVIVCVFAVFSATGVQTIKELGVGAAVAIAIDATLIRLVLAPAVMELLGDWSWWLPGPLARLLSRPGPRVGDSLAGRSRTGRSPHSA